MQVLSSRVLLSPANYEQSVRFYRELLGLRVYREFEGGTVFFLGGGFLEISRPRQLLADEKIRLWLQVDDVARAHEELATKGVAIEDAPEQKPWGLIEMTALDPDGVRLVIVEVPPHHPLRLRR